MVQAFVDVEIDGWLRFNGLNFIRDGTLRSAQLTPWRRDGQRRFFDAVQILDAEPRALLMDEILVAIDAHIGTLPPEQRMKPPRISGQTDPCSEPSRAATPREKPNTNGKRPLPPPQRLLVAKGGRA
jgi:hypothetical protein